jgi:hypothetical protein
VPGQRWGKNCRAEWMRENRPKHSELDEDAKRRANARGQANSYEGRGDLIAPKLCQMCRARRVPLEKHHFDYDFPLMVVWICRDCHLEFEGRKNVARETFQHKRKES